MQIVRDDERHDKKSRRESWHHHKKMEPELKKNNKNMNGETEAMSNILQTSLSKSYSSIISNSSNTNKIMTITTIIIGNLY